MREKMESKMRETEEHRQMREMRDRGERVETKYSYFFYNTATVQFYLWNCTVASIAKNLQYLPLPFFDVDDFKVINAKFSLNMALAFFNANALKEPISVLLEPREILGGNPLIIGFEPNLVHLHVFIPNSIIISFVPSIKILKLGPSQLKFFILP